MKTLVTGWFSFEGMGASAGDMLSLDLTREWLEDADVPYDVALAAPFAGGVDWTQVDPADYANVVFVCGPIGNGPPVDRLLQRFAGARLVGVNVSMLEPLSRWNPFDALFERDSSVTSRPDLTFLASPALVPVVGVIRIDAQPEYGVRDLHDAADVAIDRLFGSRDVACIPIDTRLDLEGADLRTAEAVDSAIARMDMVVTTRLHGMVLALRRGVPALAIDSVQGGGKITRQAETIGWPFCLAVDDLDDVVLNGAFDECLGEPGRRAARETRTRAGRLLSTIGAEVVTSLRRQVT